MKGTVNLDDPLGTTGLSFDLFGSLAVPADATAKGVAKLAAALRPVLVLTSLENLGDYGDLDLPDLAAAIATDYDTIAGALKALGATGIPSKKAFDDAAKAAKDAADKIGEYFDDLKATPLDTNLLDNPPTFTAAELTPIDVLITGILNPLLGAVQSILKDPVALIFEKLPNLLYNRTAIAALFDIGLFAEIDALMGGAASIRDMLGPYEDYIVNLDVWAGKWVNDALSDLMKDYKVTLKLDAKDLINKLAGAGDLKNGVVVADKTLVYNILVNFLWNAVKGNKDAIVGLAAKALPQVPKFLWTIAYFLVRALLWMFRI
jgi:hypothetical protein